MSPTLRITLGIICIALGIVGSFVPILQGWIFFLLGVLLLSRHVPFFNRILKQLKAWFPKTAAAVEHLEARIHRKGVRQVLKEKVNKLKSKYFRQSHNTSRLIIGFIGWFIICFLAGWIGSMAIKGDWYAKLQKPPFNPPDWVFAPVWIVLYFSMAVAAWLVWGKRGFLKSKIPMALFIIQLGLNAAWPWIFFNLRAPGWAFLEIILLWFFLLFTLTSFWIESPPAGALLVPYFGWVSYAALINYTIWRMNI